MRESFANMGAQLVLESAVKTGNTAGDGTTTATVLAHVIDREGTKLVAAGYHPLALKRGIDVGVERVVEALAKMSRRVAGKRDIAKVATISANGDATIGKLIAEAVGKVGLEGIIHVEQGQELETKLEVAEGAEIEGGYSSAYFVTDMERLVARLDDAYILLYPNKIDAVAELVPILEKVAKTGRSLLVVAELARRAAVAAGRQQDAGDDEGVRGQGAGTTARRARPTCMISAAQTGGRVIGEEPGIRLGEVKLEDLGPRQEDRRRRGEDDRRRRRHQPGGAGGARPPGARALRGHELDVPAPAARGSAAPAGRRRGADPRRRDHRRGDARAQASLRGRAVRDARRDRGRDRRRRRHRAAARGRRAREAAEEPPGGGARRHRDRAAGVRGAVPPDRRERRPGRVGDPGRVRQRKGAFGYNAARDTFENLMDAGVVDPTMVVRLALQHAASIAGLLLSSEALIADVRASRSTTRRAAARRTR